jgi:hypothetical protein
MQYRSALVANRFRPGLATAIVSLCAALTGLSLAAAVPARAEITALTASATAVTTTVGTAIAPVTFSTTGTPIGTPVSFASVGALPLGLTLDPVTGALSGAPAEPGAYPITVTATDPGPDNDPATTADNTVLTSGVVTITANAGLAPAVQPSVEGIVGVELRTATLTPVGFPADPAPDFTVTPVLPAGWTLDLVTHAIIGTPTATAAAQVYQITATSGSITAASTVSISVPPAAVTPAATTLVAPLNTAITPIVFTSTGFATAPTLSISPVLLPTGLTFDPVARTLSGTPTQASPVTAYTVTATSGGVTATATVNLSVTASALAPRSIIASVGTTITPTLGYLASDFTTAGLVGTPTLTVSPALPAGLTMSATTGVITGTPAVAVTTPTEFTITATDANGATAKALVTITVTQTQLAAPVIYYAQAGTTSGSLRVLFLGPINAPAGQVYAAEVFDATGATLVKTVKPMTSLTDITGLTPGTTYSVIIVAEASNGYLAARSAPKTGVASLGGTKLIPPTITAISGGPTAGSISVSFSPTPNAPAGLTYTVQVYDEDQLTLITALPKALSPTMITGLTPGVTYFVYVAADATATTIESLSRGRTVMATVQRGVATNAVSAATVSSANSSKAASTASSTLGAGWQRPTAAQVAKAKRVTVAMRPAATPGRAPVVKVPAKRAVILRLKGLTAQALYITDVKLAGTWVSLGSSRANWGGVARLPAFTATSPGTYLLRLTAIGQSATFLKVRVVKKGTA